MSSDMKNSVLNILIAIFILFFQIVVLKYFVSVCDFIATSFIILLTTLAVVFYGFKRIRANSFDIEIYKKTLIVVLLYFIFFYGLGLYTGFNRNGYSLALFMIIRNMICPLFIIIFMELYRHVIVNSTSDKKKIYFSTMMLALFEVFINLKFSSLTNFFQFFRLSTTIIIPIIVKNIILTMICDNTNCITGLIYRLPTELYVFLLPIIPDFSDYLVSMIGVFIPILFYMLIYNDIKEKNNPELNIIDASMLKGGLTIYEYFGLAFLIVLITLVSGFFPYTIIAVGSNSMSPSIKLGDAVIYRRVKNAKDLKKNDIIVYHNKEGHNDIVHRLVKINKDKDGNYSFVTKGDNNNSSDKVYIELDDIKGIVKCKFSLIGYPTIMFSDFIKK